MSVLVPAILLSLGQTAAQSQTIELRGRINESHAASELVVGADGIVTKCEPARRSYDNVLRPPDLCGAYRPGTRYSPPATFKGKPQRRKVRITITTWEENISD
jgi:hypothetical protein